MKITYCKISGWDGAMRSFFMTNKKYDKQIEERLQKVEKYLILREYGIINDDEECEESKCGK